MLSGNPDPHEDLNFLRDEALRANESSLTIKGFAISTTALLVGFALSSDSTPTNQKALLFTGVQILQIVLSLMIGARRRQQANAIAYQLVFGGNTSVYERRIKKLRMMHTLPVDRWYILSESLLAIVLALIGGVGSLTQLFEMERAAFWLVFTIIAVNTLSMGLATWQAVFAPGIKHLVEKSEEQWQDLREAELRQANHFDS